MNANSFAGAIRAANERASSSPAPRTRERLRTDASKETNDINDTVRNERSRVVRRSISQADQASEKSPWPVTIFMISLIIPWIISISGINLFVYRIVLLLVIIPCLILLRSGRAGALRLVDFGVFGFSLWAALTLLMAHGIGGGLQSAAILIIETTGPYLLARIFIRSPENFRGMVRLAVGGVFLLLPFALYECLTGAKPLLNIFGMVFPTFEQAVIPRAGVFRVQGPFEHSIIFGVNCASVLTFSVLVLNMGTLRKLVTAGGISLTAFLSISSAPIASLIIQIMLLSWNWIFRAYPMRWTVIFCSMFLGYLVVEFGSNQTPIQFYITHFTFDQQTGWYRLSIWEHGSASVLANPLFGIGLNDWVRPEWMHSSSVDNFWLLLAMRHGLPALLLLLFAIGSLIFGLISKPGLNRELGDYRVAVIMCLVVYIFLGSTVHLWNATYAWFFFLLGSGVWILDAKPTTDKDVEESNLRNGRARRSSSIRNRPVSRGRGQGSDIPNGKAG